MTHGILDTSTVLLLGSLDAAALPDESSISAVTLAELSVGPLVAADDDERARRQAHLQLVDDFQLIPFGAAEARAFGAVAAALRRAGRKPSARAFDAMIAATALANGLPLYTCNARDVAMIDGLEVVALTPS